jgi:glucose/mannose-6-phosphate isomerase
VSDALEPPFEDRDPSAMAALIEGAPAQIEEALARAAHSPWRLPVAAPDLIAVGAMGGSAMGAELAAGLEGDRLPRPFLIARDYRWPGCVGPASLAVLSSYSGSTEETLALYAEAGARGVPRVAISTGGALGAACDRDGVAWMRLPHGMPPRAALYASWVTWSLLLATLGWTPDPVPAWREAGRLLARRVREWGPRVPEASNPAKRLARALAGRLVFLYGGTARVAPVVTRWRHQLNENAKLPAHSATAPELNHNEIVGWERPGPLEGRAAAILLRDAEDAPEVALRLTLTGEYVERRGVPVTEVRETEGGRLARVASTILFGDFVSFYLAMLDGVDPTPIASIDAFKRRLDEERGARAR